jgi:hypothetical protein
MHRDEDPFDLERLRMPMPEREVPDSIAATKKRRRRRQFTMVPNSWVEDLRKARYIGTYRVAHYLLYRHWKNGGQPITLSNVVLAERGLTKWQKWRALAELERLGLVKVVRRPRRAPVITVLITKLEA